MMMIYWVAASQMVSHGKRDEACDGAWAIKVADTGLDPAAAYQLH
jgi:hypothetical protein